MTEYGHLVMNSVVKCNDEDKRSVAKDCSKEPKIR